MRWIFVVVMTTVVRKKRPTRHKMMLAGGGVDVKGDTGRVESSHQKRKDVRSGQVDR